MKVVVLILSVYLGACSSALAQSSGSTSAGSSTGAGGAAGALLVSRAALSTARSGPW
jgi:hypothetical protein